MVYSAVLLDALKNINLVDPSVMELDNDDKRIYAGYVKNAVAKFNNNPELSIGVEVSIIDKWFWDGISFCHRIVRNEYMNNPQPAEEHGNEVWIRPLIWNGVNGRTMQELPQRILSATENFNNINRSDPWYIVNAETFHSKNQDNVIYYEVNENEAWLRVYKPATLKIVFNRAILFPWEEQYGESINAATGQYNSPLDVQVQFPQSHVPLFTNMVSYETALGLGMLDKLESVRAQIGSQMEDLSKTNLRDRVKQSFTSRDNAWNFWSQRFGG